MNKETHDRADAIVSELADIEHDFSMAAGTSLACWSLAKCGVTFKGLDPGFIHEEIATILIPTLLETLESKKKALNAEYSAL